MDGVYCVIKDFMENNKKIKPKESIKSYCNNHLHEIPYWHILPKWMQFCLFIHRGLFNGYVSKNYFRLFCWFGFHKWNLHKYEKCKDGVKTGEYNYLCKRCCMNSKIYGK